MLQRIQTLFLLAAVGLLTGMFFNPIANYTDGTVYYTSSWVLLTLLIVSTAVAFTTIFLYRHRMLQVRLCTFNAIVLLGLQGVVVYCVATAAAGGVFSITVAFPVIAVILTLLAMRYILVDEAKIKALQRLR
jgi:hypothetical protein